MNKDAPSKVWIDLDNTPHVPFFEPIIEELKARGHSVVLSARDAYQVCELADSKGLVYTRIGRHYGKHWAFKFLGTLYRCAQVIPFIMREKPALGLSHGSRAQLIASRLVGVPTFLLADYEHAQHVPMFGPTYEMVPDVIPDEALYCPKERIRKYKGLKEDVYAWRLKPDPAILAELRLQPSDLVITVRPPATEAHYHNPESEILFTRFMTLACQHPDVRVVLLPRSKRQGHEIARQWPTWFQDRKTVIPDRPVDGMNLIWHSDLVVSGGGTMNREAAALGVPVYSIFRGTTGAVDRDLEQTGRLVMVKSAPEVENMIKIQRRVRRPLVDVTNRSTLHQVIVAIEGVLQRTS